ncbi:MAG: carbohydrate-binding domain-containing protein [Cyanobacteria bacterium J06554_1]
MIDAFIGIDPVDPIEPAQTGSAKITVRPGSNINVSTFNDKSFTVENTGDKRIAAIFIDITDALFPDTVYDPVGLAGDSAFRGLKFNTTGSSGAFEPSGDDVLLPFFGIGGVDGYEGMLVTFDSNVDGGYESGEIIKFGVDVDPNSVVGLPKKPVDINGNDPRLNNWDIAGVSGAELINAKVHVLFTDGTTAVGELVSDDSQGGGVAVASQNTPNKEATLTVNNLAAGESGTYSQNDIQVLVSGTAGDTARVTLVQGFIQTFDYIDPDGNPVNVSDKFIGSPFPANNALKVQTVDVLLDGTQQDITSQFDFNAPGGNLAFPGDNTLPIGLTASIIDGNELPIGPATEPIYLTHIDAGVVVNTAPTTSGIADVTVVEGAADTVVPLFDAFADAQDADTALTYTITNNTNPNLVTPSAISSADGELTLNYVTTGIGSADITVRATDSKGLFVEDTFTVTVTDPLANTAPTTSGIANVTVTEGAANTVVPLFDAFADAQDTDTALTYTVTGNTNPALVIPSAISSADGELTLSYVATGNGTADITVRATDTEGLFVEDTFTVTVNEVAPPPPDGMIRIEAENYIGGTNGVEYFDKSAGNSGGAAGFTDDVDVEVTQDTGGGFNITDIKKNEYLNYAVNVPTAGIYDLVTRVATTRGTPRNIDVSIGGQTYTVSFTDTGGNQSWQDVIVPGVALSAGEQTMLVTLKSGGFNLNYFELRPQGDLPNTAPTTSGIADVSVLEGSADTVVPLFDAFADAEDADTALTYTVVGNTNPTLVTSSAISSTDGELTLDYAATGTGSADITVRATDTEGLFVEDTFTVTVNDSLANTAPTTSGITDITVTEDAADTVVPLFDAFADAQDADTALTYTVTNNTNPALVTPSTISSTDGELILDYAATGTGSADITVRATDTEGLFVEDTFTVTVNEEAPQPPGVDRRIEAEDYKAGTNGVEFFDTSSANLGGAYRPDEPVDIQTTQDIGGGFNVGWIKSGEFLTYEVVESGLYDIVVRVATGKASRSLTLSTAGQSYTTTFDSTGGNQSWQDVLIPGVTLSVGQDLRLESNTNGFNLNYIDLISTGPDLESPQAALNSPSLQLPIDSTADAFFTVEYTDNIAVESDTLDNQDIQVNAPGGAVLNADFFSATPSGDGASLLVTYTISAPNGGWQAADSGTYSVDVLAGQVEDTSTNPIAAQQFDLSINVSDPPTTEYTYGIADVVVLEGANNSSVDLFAAFTDNQDADTALQYEVTGNTNPGLVSTSVDPATGILTLDYTASGTGSADITVRATDASGSFVETDFTARVVTPQASDGVIRINAGGGSVYDENGNLFLADTNFSGGQAASISSDEGIANTKSDVLYQTQRRGSNFSYSIPVVNGNYIVNAHLVDWESTEFGQRTFDLTVEGQSYYDDLDIYGEIKNAFLDGQDTAKIIQGPDNNTVVVANVTDGSLDISFDASLNDATIAALEISPVEAGILITETNDSTQVTEGSSVDSYTVVLATQPTSDVTITLQVDGNQLTTNESTLTFTTTNWDQAQTINVTPVDDTAVEGIHTSTISHTASSADTSYDSVQVSDVEVTILDNDSSGGGGEIAFSTKVITETDIKGPTSATFGPDGRLYVSYLNGTIQIFTLSDDYDILATETVDVVNNVSNNNITGLAFNPYDTDSSDPILYVSHNQFYANGGAAFPATEFSPYSGQVSTLQKNASGVWELTPVVTGIGVSNHDHGVNGLVFDNNGDLYITVGSNTNAGVADSDIGGIDESPFTAAILKAEITKPNFNGNIQYELIDESELAGAPQEFLDSLPDEIFNPPADLPFDPADSQFWGGYVDVVPGVDVSVYASGLRNPYDQVFTTGGEIYATENNANGGFGDVSLGPYTQEPFGKQQPEELNLITEGAYFGSPNRNRGRTDARQNIYYESPVDIPAEGYTAPIGTFAGSTNGIDEYRATTFDSQLRGNLLAQRFGAKKQLYSIDLSADGQQVDSIVDLNVVANVTGENDFVANGLDVVTGPGGVIIGADFNPDEIHVAIPVDPTVTDPTAYDIFPWRAPAQSGADFIIGGVNFDDLAPGGASPTLDLDDVQVFIGDQEATAEEAIITGISDKRIQGILPDLSSQPNQLLDLFIKDSNGLLISTINDAFLPL